MAKQVMAIKMRTKKDKGKFKYPDFDKIVPADKRGGIRWQEFVSNPEKCAGHHYDPKTADDVEGIENVILVAVPFGEAVKAKPSAQYEIIDEDAFAAFYEDASSLAPDYHANMEVIEALKVKYGVAAFDDKTKNKMRTEAPEDYAAIDPESDVPGVVKNKLKTFAGFKAKHGIEIVEG